MPGLMQAMVTRIMHAFHPASGFGQKDEKEMYELKVKEIRNGRLAMLAFLGFAVQAEVTHAGPFQNLLVSEQLGVGKRGLTSLWEVPRIWCDEPSSPAELGVPASLPC